MKIDKIYRNDMKIVSFFASSEAKILKIDKFRIRFQIQ